MTLMAGPNLADLGFIKDLLETGKVTPFIDRYVPLSEAAAALTYVENRHVRGKVVINVAHDYQQPLHESVAQHVSQGV
jgi:NADPH:quinone reductase-like Zn-dependent oxidoreductase